MSMILMLIRMGGLIFGHILLESTSPATTLFFGIQFVFCALFVREMAADGFSVIEVRDQERLKVLEREYHNAEAFLKVYEPYR
jgi:hypothetical protein